MSSDHSTDVTNDSGALTGQDAWERRARLLLDEGQNFLVHDTCREALKTYPHSYKLAIYGATALSQTGADVEARRLLKPVIDALLVDEGPFRRLERTLRRAVDQAGLDSEESLSAMVDLAEAMELARGRRTQITADAETYGSLAQVLRESWLSTGDTVDLDLAGELYLRAYQSGADPKDGISAASLLWFKGKRAEAVVLAERVVRQLGAHLDADISADGHYERLATKGLAALLLGHHHDALGAFRAASTLAGTSYPPAVALLKQLDLFGAQGIAVPAEVHSLIKPPQVVVFTGHALDRAGAPMRFPPLLEATVRAEIVATLDEIDARVGFSMASCGSELLFIEAMLERGAEVNVVLPFDLDDFIATNVRYGGARWEMRFRNALRLAATVTYATEEHYLGHDMLYRFANQCLSGLATLRAKFLCSTPTLLAVWDMMPGSLVGGAADFIDAWEDISRLRIIDLDGLAQAHPECGPTALDQGGFTLPPDAEDEAQGRVIRSMLFCDIAGYSKLAEEYVPVYLEFLALLKSLLARSGIAPMAINTWGDAIFVVTDKASPLAEYALTLQEAVESASEALKDRLPHPLSLRISLHAGPVFEAIDPICDRVNFYGSHINRAARLEPVTVIGHAYATQQFVAVMTAEQSAMRAEVGGAEFFEEKFVCEYVGQLSLAKDFGRQVVYHLRRK